MDHRAAEKKKKHPFVENCFEIPFEQNVDQPNQKDKLASNKDGNDDSDALKGHWQVWIVNLTLKVLGNVVFAGSLCCHFHFN